MKAIVVCGNRPEDRSIVQRTDGKCIDLGAAIVTGSVQQIDAYVTAMRRFYHLEDFAIWHSLSTDTRIAMCEAYDVVMKKEVS